MPDRDPKRARVTALMNKIVNEQSFSPEEEIEMREVLKKIVTYKTGDDIGFPVKPGEQVVAAFLLRSLDVVPVRGRE